MTALKKLKNIILRKQRLDSKLIINIILIVIFLAGITYLSIAFGPGLTKLMRDPQQLRDTLKSYGYVSALIFILLQFVQVVIAAIPGEFVQIAGGYIYGTFLGTLYSIIGIVGGTVIVFYLARLIGYPVVKAFVSKDKLERFNFLINSQKSEIAMFILFLIPGLPKDILTYIAGLTPVRPGRFFLIILFARFPGIIGSSIIGENLQEKDYLPVIIISVVATVLFVAGTLLRNRIIDAVCRLMHMDDKDDKD